MVDVHKLSEETVVALKTYGVPPSPVEEHQFKPEDMGVRPLTRLQIPTQMGAATEICKVLHDLINDITSLRRMNLKQEYAYGLRLQELVSVANKQMKRYTKSSV